MSGSTGEFGEECAGCCVGKVGGGLVWLRVYPCCMAFLWAMSMYVVGLFAGDEAVASPQYNAVPVPTIEILAILLHPLGTPSTTFSFFESRMMDDVI